MLLAGFVKYAWYRRRAQVFLLPDVCVCAGTLGTTTASLVPADSKAGAAGEVTLTINPLSNALVSGDSIYFEFPAVNPAWSFNSGGSTSCTVEQPAGTQKSSQFHAIAGSQFRVEVQAAIAVSSSDSLVVKCTNVKNPTAVVAAISMAVWTKYGGTGEKRDESTAQVSAITVGRRSCTRRWLRMLCVDGGSSCVCCARVWVWLLWWALVVKIVWQRVWLQ